LNSFEDTPGSLNGPSSIRNVIDFGEIKYIIGIQYLKKLKADYLLHQKQYLSDILNSF